MKAAKWILLLLTAAFFIYVYVSIVLSWWGYWKRKFLFAGDIVNYVLLTVLGYITVQIIKYVWKLEVRLLFR